MAPKPAIAGDGLTLRRLRVANADVVWLRSVLEGYDGLAALYGDGSGVVTLSTPDALAAELDALLDELCAEAALLRL
jgi:anion-transporting  ArsA/GET3 family ATPase